MALNPRLENSSNSPHGVPFVSGHLNAHRNHLSGGSNLDKCPSFRENHEGRSLVQGGIGVTFPGSSNSGHGELPPLSQVLSLEPLSLGEQKYARQFELRRAINAAVGAYVEDPSPGSLQAKPLEQLGPEELRRMKASVFDNSMRARERSRLMSEAISKLDKYQASLVSRKRARVEPSVHERPIASLSMERPATAANSLKTTICASPSHANASDVPVSKLQEKSKGAVPNKRVRTSMADVRLEGRANNPNVQRSSGLADRERDSIRPSSTLGGPVEDRDQLVSTGVQGWEKTKMKGRRSGPKPDATVITMVNGSLEGVREHKLGVQQRLNADGRSRPSEGHGFRSGPLHGIVTAHKVEGHVQQNGSAMRSINKSECDGAPSVGEKGDRFVGLGKERPPSKNGSKSSHRGESSLLNPTMVTKVKAVRAPRSSSGAPVNPSAHAARAASAGDGWDHPASNKVQLPVAPAVNRKRPAPTRSSSPPVAQWVGQRPQKMARVARRMNLVPAAIPAPSRDDVSSVGDGLPIHDCNTTVGARSTSNMSSGSGFVRRVASTTIISQGKPKQERVTPSTGPSESDESEGGDVKSKEKGKKHGDEVKLGEVGEKMGSLVMPVQKSRIVSKEEGGDGVRRQGRSGRGLVAVRGGATAASVEKVDAPADAKQLRSARPGVEKPVRSVDIKPGRPPIKKGAIEHKPLTRPRRPVGSGAGDISGESDDDHEELAAAVQAAEKASAAACSSEFWKQMEPYFAYLTQDDHEHLKQQVKEFEKEDLTAVSFSEQRGKSTLPESFYVITASKPVCLDNGNIEVDGAMVSKVFNNLKDSQIFGRDGRKAMNGGWLDKMLPLSQRLLAALIIDGDSDEGSREDRSPYEPSDCARDGSPLGLGYSDQAEFKRRDHDLESEVDAKKRVYRRWDSGPNGISCDDMPTSNGFRYRDAASTLQSDDLGEENILVRPETHLYSCMGRAEADKDNVKYFCIGSKSKDRISIQQSIGSVIGLSTWDTQYHRMNLDDRIFLELESIGLLPEPVPDLAPRDDDEIEEELKKFQLELKDQVCSNKVRIQALEKSVLTSRNIEERERDRLAMSKLVEIACNRRLGCRGVLGASGSKGSGTKGARASALAFANRTLSRWRHYAETGQSCFIDAKRRVLLCVSKDSEANALSNSGEAGELYIASSIATGSTTLGFTDSKSVVASTTSECAGQLVHMVPGPEKTDKESSESGQAMATSSGRSGGKDETWSSRTKEMEVLLEDVAGCGNIAGHAILGGTKGKRSERERDGKGQCQESPGRSDSNKGGRQGLGSIKGERKTKTKPRQKTAPLLKAVNGLLGKPAELPKESTTSIPGSMGKSVEKFMKVKDEVSLSAPTVKEPTLEAEGTIDLSHLQLPGMEDLDVTENLGGQGQDFGSWLEFEDPELQDAAGDFMGLDVPMDDLSELAMMT